jgi:hypothetical protein
MSEAEPGSRACVADAAIGIGVIILVILLPLALLVGWWMWRAPYRELPPSLGIADVLVHRAGADCTYAEYKLDAPTVARLRTVGVSSADFLNHRLSRTYDRIGGWYATPATITPGPERGQLRLDGRPADALHAPSCVSSLPAISHRLLRESGNAYALTRYGDMLIIVSSREGLAVILRYG